MVKSNKNILGIFSIFLISNTAMGAALELPGTPGTSMSSGSGADPFMDLLSPSADASVAAVTGVPEGGSHASVPSLPSVSMSLADLFTNAGAGAMAVGPAAGAPDPAVSRTIMDDLADRFRPKTPSADAVKNFPVMVAGKPRHEPVKTLDPHQTLLTMWAHGRRIPVKPGKSVLENLGAMSESLRMRVAKLISATVLAPVDVRALFDFSRSSQDTLDLPLYPGHSGIATTKPVEDWIKDASKDCPIFNPEASVLDNMQALYKASCYVQDLYNEKLRLKAPYQDKPIPFDMPGNGTLKPKCIETLDFVKALLEQLAEEGLVPLDPKASVKDNLVEMIKVYGALLSALTRPEAGGPVDLAAFFKFKDDSKNEQDESAGTIRVASTKPLKAIIAEQIGFVPVFNLKLGAAINILNLYKAICHLQDLHIDKLAAAAVAANMPPASAAGAGAADALDIFSAPVPAGGAGGAAKAAGKKSVEDLFRDGLIAGLVTDYRTVTPEPEDAEADSEGAILGGRVMMNDAEALAAAIHARIEAARSAALTLSKYMRHLAETGRAKDWVRPAPSAPSSSAEEAVVMPSAAGEEASAKDIQMAMEMAKALQSQKAPPPDENGDARLFVRSTKKLNRIMPVPTLAHLEAWIKTWPEGPLVPHERASVRGTFEGLIWLLDVLDDALGKMEIMQASGEEGPIPVVTPDRYLVATSPDAKQALGEGFPDVETVFPLRQLIVDLQKVVPLLNPKANVAANFEALYKATSHAYHLYILKCDELKIRWAAAKAAAAEAVEAERRAIEARRKAEETTGSYVPPARAATEDDTAAAGAGASGGAGRKARGGAAQEPEINQTMAMMLEFKAQPSDSNSDHVQEKNNLLGVGRYFVSKSIATTEPLHALLATWAAEGKLPLRPTASINNNLMSVLGLFMRYVECLETARVQESKGEKGDYPEILAAKYFNFPADSADGTQTTLTDFSPKAEGETTVESPEPIATLEPLKMLLTHLSSSAPIFNPEASVRANLEALYNATCRIQEIYMAKRAESLASGTMSDGESDGEDGGKEAII